MKQLAIGYTVRKGQSESRIQKLGSRVGALTFQAVLLPKEVMGPR